MSVDVVTLAIPARTEYLILARLALAGIAREVEIDQATLADLKLAVTEACGNAVRHAQPGGRRDGDRPLHGLRRRDRDHGRGRRPGDGRATPVAAMPDGELSESGMGLAIIHALVDRVEIGPGEAGRGTVVRMRRLRSASPSA